MFITTVFIQAPNDWQIITRAVIALTRGVAADVRYIGSIDELSSNRAVVEIVVTSLQGEAAFALEIHWKGMTNLADDSVGMYLAKAVGSAMLAPRDTPSSDEWLLLEPDGGILEIELDVEQLNQNSTVSFSRC